MHTVLHRAAQGACCSLRHGRNAAINSSRHLLVARLVPASCDGKGNPRPYSMQQTAARRRLQPAGKNKVTACDRFMALAQACSIRSSCCMAAAALWPGSSGLAPRLLRRQNLHLHLLSPAAFAAATAAARQLERRRRARAQQPLLRRRAGLLLQRAVAAAHVLGARKLQLLAHDVVHAAEQLFFDAVKRLLEPLELLCEWRWGPEARAVSGAGVLWSPILAGAPAVRPPPAGRGTPF
jgi:hypothetical protein